mgnify:CR=1 FL=1
MDANELLTVTSSIGEMLIEYGAEIYRVEESINRIAAAYGFSGEENSVEVFAIPTSLIITVNDVSGLPLTRTKRITSRQTNLDRVDAPVTITVLFISSSLSFKLILIKLVVSTVFCEKLFMAARFNYLTVVNNDYLVGVTDS